MAQTTQETMVSAGVFGWSSETWTAVGTLALASVTFLAVIFQDPIRRRYNRAKLSMSVGSGRPDVHFITMTFYDADGVVIHREQVLYVRVIVTHKGGRTAEGVELYADNLRRPALSRPPAPRRRVSLPRGIAIEGLGHGGCPWLQ
jgi:hypothetical protein